MNRTHKRIVDILFAVVAVVAVISFTFFVLSFKLQAYQEIGMSFKSALFMIFFN
jgi:hypothetical protein